MSFLHNAALPTAPLPSRASTRGSLTLCGSWTCHSWTKEGCKQPQMRWDRVQHTALQRQSHPLPRLPKEWCRANAQQLAVRCYSHCSMLYSISRCTTRHSTRFLQEASDVVAPNSLLASMLAKLWLS